MKMLIHFNRENLKEREYFGDPSMNGRLVIK
jgi:hypothetical protein